MNFFQAENQLNELILPFFQKIDLKISRNFPAIRRRLYFGPSGDLAQHKSYSILLDCQLLDNSQDDIHDYSRNIILLVDLKQRTPEAPPMLNALVMESIKDIDDLVRIQFTSSGIAASKQTFQQLVEELPRLDDVLMSTLGSAYQSE